MASRNHTQCAQDYLCRHSSRHISGWIGQFFGHVGYGVWRANRECSVEHTRQECDSIAPARSIILAEITPHCRVTGMHFGHGCDYDDGYDSTNDD